MLIVSLKLFAVVYSLNNFITVLNYTQDAEVDAGWMGAGMVFTGMAGSLLLGAVLDKTHRFK